MVVNGLASSSGGAAAILSSFLTSFAANAAPGWRAEVYVRDSRGLPHDRRIAYIVPELPRSSLLMRLVFDGWQLRSRYLAGAVDVFISFLNCSARIRAGQHFVYCHQALPLVRLAWPIYFRQPALLIRRLLTEALYRFAILRSATVIVQQEWLRTAFCRYGPREIIVAWPLGAKKSSNRSVSISASPSYRIFYPLGPYGYKNAEVLIDAVRRANHNGDHRITVTLTISPDENSYARFLAQRAAADPAVRFVGALPLAAMATAYANHDLLVFPSLAETWGLPLSEAKACGLPILAADLPYAREAVGDYDRAGFFDPADADALAHRLAGLAAGNTLLGPTQHDRPREPFAADWKALVAIITGTGLVPQRKY